MVFAGRSYFHWSDGRVYPDSPYTYSVPEPSSTRTHSELSDWLYRISHLVDASQAYTRVETKILEAHEGHIICTGRKYNPKSYPIYGSEGFMDPEPSFPTTEVPAFVSTLPEDAYVEMLGHLREKFSFSGSTLIGELGQTVHMLKHPAMALRRQIDRYIDGMRNRKGRTPLSPKAISDSWLEASFGWSPLINDIEDLTGAIVKRIDRDEVFYATGKAGDRGILYSFESKDGQGSTPFIESTHVDSEVSVRCYGLFRRAASPVSPLVQAGGLGTWQDAVIAGWELLPWSFLIDYFSNVGDCLTAAVTISEVNKVYAGYTRKTRNTASFTQKPLSGVYYPYELFQPSLVKTESFRFDRIPISTLYVPIPRCTWTSKINGRKLLNIGALISSKFFKERHA